MTAPTLRCARCHRRLVKAFAWMSGLPLGPSCARSMADAVRASPTPLELQADRDRAAAATREFNERQLTLPALP